MSFKSYHAIVKLRTRIHSMKHLYGKHSGPKNNNFCCFITVIQRTFEQHLNRTRMLAITATLN